MLSRESRFFICAVLGIEIKIKSVTAAFFDKKNKKYILCKLFWAQDKVSWVL